MLQFFDTHVRADAVDSVRLENLAYFEVKTVLVASHAPRPFETSEDLLTYFNDLVTNELHRLQRGGVRAVFALAVHPQAVPRRVHYEIWRELPSQLADSTVVAVGELALEEDDRAQEALIRRQLAVAAKLNKPALISPGLKERARRVRRILDLVRDVGIDPEQVLVNHVDFTSLRAVLDAGCRAGLTVGSSHLEPRAAAELIGHYREAALARCMFNSSLSQGPADVLALPKAALALVEAGFTTSEIRGLVWGNARRLFLPHG